MPADLLDCLTNKKCYSVKCCYCGTEEKIYPQWKRYHGTTKDYAPSSRLKQTLNFTKDHYDKIQRELEVYNKYVSNGLSLFPRTPPPDCRHLRETQKFLDYFIIIDENDAQQGLNPNDKDFKKMLKQIRASIKPK
jgi:hypothetical protein